MDRPAHPSPFLSNDAAPRATGAGADTSTQWQIMLVDAHYQQSPLVVVSGLVLSALMCRVLWTSAPQTPLLIWLALIQTLMLLRLATTVFYLKGDGRARWSLQRWLRVTHVQAILSGLSWGGLGLFYPATDDVLGRTAIVVTQMGVCAGSAALIGSVRGTLPTFGLLAIGPLALMMILQGGTGHLYMGAALLYYVYIVMVKGPSRIARVMKALHAGQIAREILVGRLEDAERMGQMGHIVWDHEARRATLSAEARRQLDLHDDHLSNATMIWQRVIPEERECVIQLCRDAIAQRRPELRFDTRISGPIGLRDLRVVQRFVYDAADGRILRTMTTTQDITELKATQRELHDLAFHDTLTGLANRAGFQRRLHERTVHAVLMIDLDHFKNVNDTLGHTCGDRLLVAAAERLGTCLRGDDMVARLGGDEFAVLIHDALSAPQLERIAQRIVETLSAPYHIDSHDIVVSASIGIACHLGDDVDPDALMRQADTALFAAKARGRSRHEFHSEAMSARARERVALEADLRRAVAEQQFNVHYQPKIDLRDSRIIGAEALLRWRHPERGQVPPDHFIPIAEDCGLIVPIGEWVLRQSCAAAVHWNAHRPADRMLRIAVNLSPRQFVSHDLIRSVRHALEDTGCRPEWIELEITERLLLDDRGQAEDTLHRLRAMGLTLAIDDFGTGYSALGYLTRFPIGTLKIDKSFMRDITTRADRAGVVRAIISMGHSLRLGLVAEGVETEEQARFLREQGCELAQGWLYGRPVPRDEFDALLARQDVSAPTPAPA